MAGALFALGTACGSDATGTGGAGGGAGGSGGGAGGGAGGGGGAVLEPPALRGDFAFHGVEQGLSPTVFDVSADEGGNVYVAAGDAVFAKARGDETFRRFEPADAGLTRNCDAAGRVTCPIVSVGGVTPGTAVVGFKGVGNDGDFDPDWQQDSGGADVVSFDGTRLTRTRHVFIAGVPHSICESPAPDGACPDWDPIWSKGRRKLRQVLRIAVNHRVGTVHHGDVWMGGTHSTLAALVGNAEARGYPDRTVGWPGFEDARDVWEHDHPAPWLPFLRDGQRTEGLLTGDAYAVAIDPLTGDPWGSNGVRTAGKVGYGASALGFAAEMWPPFQSPQVKAWMDVWPDAAPADGSFFDALDPRWLDGTSSMSFCDDGTLWIASELHGLARVSIDRAAARTRPHDDWRGHVGVEHVALPDGKGGNAWAVACDPDGSLWVGFGWGGFGRLRNGAWEVMPPDVPRSAWGPVRSIQIDRWASRRIVYFAHVESALGPGGVTVYDGP